VQFFPSVRSALASPPGLCALPIRFEINVVTTSVDPALPLQPNIIRVVDTFQTCSMIYIVMELLRGGDLFDRIIEKERYAIVLVVLSGGVCCAAFRALPSAACAKIGQVLYSALSVLLTECLYLMNYVDQ
jgi:serine/threonine protein kinase